MSSATRKNVPTKFALVIGAMKSGTTSLFHLLSQHPQIAECSLKEPSYFSDQKIRKRGRDWYLDLWNWDPARHKIALEATPAYTTFPARPGVPQQIAEFDDAEFRFIYIMRNPVEQIESNVRHTLYAGWGSSLDQGIPGWMIDITRYATQIEQYLAVFPADRLLLLTLEEFEENPEAVLRRVCQFLEVDHDFVFHGVRERYNTGQVYKMPPVFARVARTRFVRWIMRRVLPRSFVQELRFKISKLVGSSDRLGRYQLTPREKAHLFQMLEPELQRLESLYGVPVSKYWLPASVSTLPMHHIAIQLR